MVSLPIFEYRQLAVRTFHIFSRISAMLITGPKFIKSPKLSSVCGNIIFMSEFRTIIKTHPGEARMAISDQIFTIGSCFSDAIGQRLRTYKLKAHVNPTGISYNPISIHHLLNLAVGKQALQEDNCTSGEVVFHYDFHSSLYAKNRTELAARLAQTVSQCKKALLETTWLIITYGTAWIYSRKDNGRIVSNCHKQPADWFTKTLLGAAAVEESFQELHSALLQANPGLNIMLTISPVRHLKDTLEGNSVSKSVLRVACENLTRRYPNVFYFPSYEIMMDDLRDYRFYKSDMIHPNDVAEEYIWDKFAGTWFDKELQSFVKSWRSILQALEHRPFHPNTDAHQSFVKATLEKIEAWSAYVDVNDERKHMLQQLVR